MFGKIKNKWKSCEYSLVEAGGSKEEDGRPQPECPAGASRGRVHGSSVSVELTPGPFQHIDLIGQL